MNQGLSHYVNASGTNWDTLIPFYLMAYRATPHGTSVYSPYYLLHGRKMILPTSQDLRAKLSPDVRETEYARKLENLKSTLKAAYKSVRENSYNSHVTNKMYFDRRAKERIFKARKVLQEAADKTTGARSGRASSTRPRSYVDSRTPG